MGVIESHGSGWKQSQGNSGIFASFSVAISLQIYQQFN